MLVGDAWRRGLGVRKEDMVVDGWLLVVVVVLME